MTGARTVHRALLLLTALLFSTGGAAIKAATLTGWQVASFRSLVAAVALAILVPDARRGWNWRTAPVGCAYGATLVLFVLATKLTTAANAIFLQSAAPLYVLAMGPLLLRERVRRADLAFMGVIGLGLVLFFTGTEPAAATAPDPARGNMIAAITGITWAFTIVGLRWFAHCGGGGPPSLSPLVAGNLIAFAVALPAALPVPQISRGDVLAIGYLGVFQIGLAYWCMTAALRHVPALEASTLLLLEPVLNPVWAWLWHGERPGRWTAAGGALILGATLANTWWRSRGDTVSGRSA
jgi:drug/metabolite transporter (DMT)-like permease